MAYSRQIMVSTRAFITTTALCVIGRPRLYSPAIRLYSRSRAKNARGIKKLFPSGRYLRFRIYTQYGNEEVSKAVLKKDLIHYLEWVKAQDK